MGKKDEAQKEKQRVQSVLELLSKRSPLTTKQERFCNNACVQRFLKAKGDSVKKTAKQLRNCLAWRDSIGTDTLIADEFSAELAEGVAYVAGHDYELRPVMIFRVNQDYQKCHSNKLFTRLLVFTLEVAIQTMTKNVDQFVILFDASLFRSASALMNMLLTMLKITSDYYPGRLHRAFVIDPHYMFTYFWKGVKPFVELSSLTVVVSSLDYEDSLAYNDFTSDPLAKVGSCSSSRFSFTVSHHFESVKPWYLSLTDTSTSKVGPTNPSSILSVSTTSPRKAKCCSFASPIARSTPRDGKYCSRTPKPSFLRSPALFFRRDSHQVEKSVESFAPFMKFYQRPYDEMTYRSKMRPPLGGLISILSPQLKHGYISNSQRF